MTEVQEQPELILVNAFGGTNARTGIWTPDGIEEGTFASEPTPKEPKGFFRWLGRKMLDGAHDRQIMHTVNGYPGPVSPDGRVIGPMANVDGLANEEYEAWDSILKAEPAADELLDAGYVLLNVNDGELAAHAVAARIARPQHNSVAALIIGTGQGAGLVRRDRDNPAVFRADRNLPLETGWLLRDPLNPKDTPESTIAGPAIERATGIDPRKIPAEHHIWQDVGHEAGRLAFTLGIITGADLVVPTGGVGAGSSVKFKDHMQLVLDRVQHQGNATQRKFIPETAYVDPDEAQKFELYGAGSIMADFLTRKAQAA